MSKTNRKYWYRQGLHDAEHAVAIPLEVLRANLSPHEYRRIRNAYADGRQAVAEMEY